MSRRGLITIENNSFSTQYTHMHGMYMYMYTKDVYIVHDEKGLVRELVKPVTIRN